MSHLIELKDIYKIYHMGEETVHALDGINLTGDQGEFVAFVGSSGSGKSTLARTILALTPSTSGQVFYQGEDITDFKVSAGEKRRLRSEIQMIFQDPYASLNPRQKIMEILTEPMLFHKLCSSKAEAEEKAIHLLERVGLSSEQANRYPHQFSGGQRQRIGIARALAVEPKFIIADEPVSALDVSIQAQILNILMDLKDEFHFSYLFIAHDLSVVKLISHEIMVMYLGQCVEYAKTEELFKNPLHPYTKGLLDAVPIPSLKAKKLSTEVMRGELTSPVDPAPGCRFAARCPYATDACRGRDIPLKEVEPGHFVSCTRF